jgi:hypothetical protein
MTQEVNTMIFCKTDYPLCGEDTICGPSPDIAGKEAPLREAVVLGWDGDKYATVFVQFPDGDIGLYDFKLGYCYETENLKNGKHGKSLPRDSVPILSSAMRDTFREYFAKMSEAINTLGAKERAKRAKLPSTIPWDGGSGYDLYNERPQGLLGLIIDMSSKGW